MSENMKQSRILTVPLTLEISTGLPHLACSIFGSKLFAVLRYILACSRLFSFFALRAAFMYCFFLFSRNSSCSRAEKQYKTPHSSGTAMPLKQVYHLQLTARSRSRDIKYGHFLTALNCFSASFNFNYQKKKRAFFCHGILHQKTSNTYKCHNSNYGPLSAGRRQTPV